VTARRAAAAVAWLVVAAAAAAAAAAAQEPVDLGALAQCVSDSGALFYGAHWCPYCRQQKEYFEGNAGALPYVECYDGPRSKGMNAACRNAGVRSFPTWVFADGSVKTGLRSPSQLAADAGCD